jgi:hypothetical protein
MSEHRLPNNAYYEHRPVRHHAQGDVYNNVPFYYGTLATSTFQGEGARTRPSITEDDLVPKRRVGFGVICSYTCGFMSQPPKSCRDYGHPFRLMAPIQTLDELSEDGLADKDRRNVEEMGVVHGLMYVPHPMTGVPSAVCAYRTSLVHSDALPEEYLVKRFSESAQRILMNTLIQVVSPAWFSPYPEEGEAEDPFKPDLSDGWPDD